MQDTLDKGVAPPEYVLQAQREREQLLSQWSVVSPLQRALFLELTENWTPTIDFKSFIAARSEGGVNLTTDLQALFSKLRAAKVGVLLTQKDEEGNRQGFRMILTSEADPRFWYYHLSEWFQTNSDKPLSPYLTEKILSSKDQNIRPELLTPLDLGSITKKLMEEGAQGSNIYLIPIFGGDSLVVPSRDLVRLMAFTSSKLRMQLNNLDVANAIARIMNNSLVELQKKITTKEALFWKGLCQGVFDHHEDLLADRKLRLDKDFIQAAQIFVTFLNTQLEETKRLKEEVKERDQDMKQLESVIKASEDNLVSTSEMETHFGVYKGKYADAFPLFKDDFLKLYTEHEQKTGLPPVVVFPQGLVHRDNLYLLFVKKFDRVKSKINDEFRSRMEYILRTNNRNNNLSFSSPEALEAATQDFLQARDPWLADLIKKGRLLAEAVIHHGRTQFNAKTIEELRPVMDKYFKPASTSLKTLVFLFDLDAFDLFEQSFRRLPLLTQLIIRLSGRFSTYRDRFLLLSPHTHEKPNKKSVGSSKSGGQSRGYREPSQGRDADQKSESKESGTYRRKSPTPKPKVYTKREQEAAWNKFKDRM